MYINGIIRYNSTDNGGYSMANKKTMPKYPYDYFEGYMTIYLLSGKKFQGKLIQNYQFEILVEAQFKSKETQEVYTKDILIPKHSVEYAISNKKN